MTPYRIDRAPEPVCHSAVMEAGSVAVSSLLLQYYRIIGLTEQELVVLLQVQRLQEKEGIRCPSAQHLAQAMHCPVAEVGPILQKLLDDYLQRERHPQGERYTFRPIWNKIGARMGDAPSRTWEAPSSLLRSMEKGLGRALSSLELARIASWVEEDGHTEALILAALREAIFCDVPHIRYIERLLHTWRQKNIQTPEEAATFAQTVRSGKFHRLQQKQDEASAPLPLHDWLQQGT